MRKDSQESSIQFADDEIDGRMDEIQTLEQLKENSLSLINPDTWYNIPICVVKAFKALIDHGLAQDKCIATQETQFRELDKKCHQKLVNLERRISENNNRLYESLDFRDQKATERLKKVATELEKFT